MKSLFLLALPCFLSSFALAQETATELPSAFNGKDLTGWKKPEVPEIWSVKDGVLRGLNNEKQTGDMLWTEKSYQDVIVELEVKWEDGKDVDTGIMLRKPNIQMQLGISGSLKKDMSGSFYIGKYPEEGQAKNAAQLMKKNEWNKFRLQAIADTYTVWINGTKAVEYKNDKYAEAGPVGLQIHPKRAMDVLFRNIKIQPLDATEPAKEAKAPEAENTKK